MDYAVCVDIEGDFDLRNASACGHDAVEVEHAEGLVILSEISLALKNVDFNGRLIVNRGGENLALLDGDGGVSVDNLGVYAAHSLDTE